MPCPALHLIATPVERHALARGIISELEEANNLKKYSKGIKPAIARQGAETERGIHLKVRKIVLSEDNQRVTFVMDRNSINPNNPILKQYSREEGKIITVTVPEFRATIIIDNNTIKFHNNPDNLRLVLALLD